MISAIRTLSVLVTCTLMGLSACGGKGSVQKVNYDIETGVSPRILLIDPLSVDAGITCEFTADVLGASPLSYLWDFGGGGVPDTSTSRRPVISFERAGLYSCNLTVNNNYDADSKDFQLLVKGGAPDVESFRASEGTVSRAVNITWDINPSGGQPEGFRLWSRTRTIDPYEIVAELGPDAREFTDPQPAGLVVDYQLEAWNEAGTCVTENAYAELEGFVILPNALGWAESLTPPKLAKRTFEEEVRDVEWVGDYPVVVTNRSSLDDSTEPARLTYFANSDVNGSGTWKEEVVPDIRVINYFRPFIIDVSGSSLFASREYSEGEWTKGMRLVWRTEPFEDSEWESICVFPDVDLAFTYPLSAVTAEERVFILLLSSTGTWGADYSFELAFSQPPFNENSWSVLHLADGCQAVGLGVYQGNIIVGLRYHYLNKEFIGTADASAVVPVLKLTEARNLPLYNSISTRYINVSNQLVKVESSGFYFADSESSFSQWQWRRHRIPARFTYYTDQTADVSSVWCDLPITVGRYEILHLNEGEVGTLRKMWLAAYADIKSGGPVYLYDLRDIDTQTEPKHISIHDEYLMVAFNRTGDGPRGEVHFFDLSDLTLEGWSL